MIKRPAFLDRLASRLPDVSSLRFRVQGGVALLAGAFGALLVLAAAHLDARRCAEVARTRAETLAATVGIWLDGDAHAGLGADPEKRLADLGAALEKMLETSEYPGVVRTLRPKPEHRIALSEAPDVARPGALEVVLQTGPNVVRQDVDYRPGMRVALVDGRVKSFVAGDRVVAYAPVPDSWGARPALVAVEGPASAPLWRQILFPAAATLLAGLLCWGVTLIAKRASARLAQPLALLDSAVQALGLGNVAEPVALPRRSAREFAALASSLEVLRARLQSASTGRSPASAPAAAPEAPRTALLGEVAEFDLALLVQQLVEPARKLAQPRGIEVQLVYPDGLPSQLVGHPMVLYRALDSLLRNALRTTRKGGITLRVSRAGGGSEGGKLRFELADTSSGVAFKEQQQLSASLAAARSADPNALKDPLEIASALAGAMGGELSFVSQPGQGSRFGFTVAFQGLAPSAQTGFHPAASRQPSPEPAFQAQSAAPPGPPASSFQPRPKLKAG